MAGSAGNYKSVAVDPDGNVVAVGSNGTLACYNSSGVNQGVVFDDISSSIASINAVAVQSLAGNYEYVVAGSGFQVARYNSDGSLDTTFGNNGIASAGLPAGVMPSRLLVQADGDIVLVGTVQNGSGYDLDVVRYMADGQLDTSFNATGSVPGTITETGLTAAACDAVIEAGNQIVAAVTVSDGGSNSVELVRFTSDGSLDQTFGGDGIVAVFNNQVTSKPILAAQPDGAILLAGTGTGADFALLRYLADGDLDPNFGSDGVASGSSFATATALGVEPDGQIIVAGVDAAMGQMGQGQWAIEGFTAAGAADRGFNGSASEKIDGGIYGVPEALALQADGKIVIAGDSFAAGSSSPSSPEAVVARFTSGGLGAQGEPASEILDDSQPTVSGEADSFQVQTGSGSAWQTDTTDGGLDGIQQYAPGNASNQATWTFTGLDTADFYDVYVTWSPQANASQDTQDAQYAVYNGTTTTLLPGLNQQQPPVDAQAEGCWWQSLGVYNATSGTLVVTLGAGDSGDMLADAVRIVRYETAPTTSLTVNSFSFDNQGQLHVSYTITTINGSAAPPFSIGIYGSPDGVQPVDDLQEYDVSDPTLLSAGTHTVTFTADFSDLGTDKYLMAQLDADDEVYEMSRAGNLSASVSLAGVHAVFQNPDDGNVYVFTGSGAGNIVAVTQDSTSGNLTVTVNSAATTFSSPSDVYVYSPGSDGTITIDPSVTAAVSVYQGSDGTVSGPTENLPVVSISADTPTTSETGSSSPGDFTLELSDTTSMRLGVNYTLSGIAKEGTAFTLSGAATFAAGSDSTTIEVDPKDAGLVGGSQNVVFTLDSGSNYTVDPDNSSATVTIFDNDLPTVSITANAETDTFTVTRNVPEGARCWSITASGAARRTAKTTRCSPARSSYRHTTATPSTTRPRSACLPPARPVRAGTWT